jgi:hypothetical protein
MASGAFAPLIHEPRFSRGKRMKNKLVSLFAATSLGFILAACGGGAGTTTSAATSLAGQEQVVKPEPNVMNEPVSNVAFTLLEPAPTMSRIMQERLVTVRDAIAWEKLWLEHAPQTFGVQPPPAIDFTKNMVTAVFLGSRSPCGRYGIDAVRQDKLQSRIEISVTDTPPAPNMACIALAYFPVFFVVMPQSDLPVVTVPAPPANRIDFERIAPGVFTSAIAEKRSVAIKDNAAWNTLWQEHVGQSRTAPLPPVDFSQRMVLAVFLGRESVTCGSMSIENILQRGNPERIEVQYRVVDPGPNVVCIAANLNQSSFVSVPVSSLPVEFVKLP